jgi:hypothetical protein
VFEFTSDHIKERYSQNGRPDLEALEALPALFMQEDGVGQEQPARTGTITRASFNGNVIALEYVFDHDIRPLTNHDIRELSVELGIGDWEFTRTHWAVKEHDLFKALLGKLQPRRPQPGVFSISDPEQIQANLVSAMMPFQKEFDDVFATLQAASEDAGLVCMRADNIWDAPQVMQDVVSLIDRSKIVVADCTGRNPNVFYEIGIAHTLGREVVMITQATSDIPFDLRHLRFVPYLNNEQGRDELFGRLKARFEDLANRPLF